MKSQLLTNYYVQHRGGRGKIAFNLKSNDFINNFFICNTSEILLCFSNLGKVYWFNLNSYFYNKTLKELPIVNFLKLNSNEIITNFLSIKS